MGVLSDMFDFDKIWHEDMLDKIKDDPWRLLVGSMEPFSTELWNGILGRDDEPIMNQLGGPMGSGWAGLGETGGVYDTAREEGVNLKYPTMGHDAAEMVAMFYGGGAAAEGLGNAFGAGAEAGAAGGDVFAAGTQPSGATTYAMPETGSLGGGEFIDASGNAIGGGFSWKDFGQNLMKNPPQFQQPQQAQNTPQHQFTQQQLAALLAPQPAQEAQAKNNAMSLLLQQHRG